MKVYNITIALLLSLSTITNTSAHEGTWNILSLDGGGIRGLITATIADYMESYTYHYAREKYCIPEEKDE